VIDPNNQPCYVVAATKENGVYFQRLHALSVTTGAEQFGGPVVIAATVMELVRVLRGASFPSPSARISGRGYCSRMAAFTSHGLRTDWKANIPITDG